MTFRRVFVSAFALVALMALATPTTAASFRVKASGSPGSFRWQPDFRHINKGDKIVWKNPTGSTHTVAAYSGRWSKNSTLPSGGRTTFRFRKTGAVLYRCTQPGHSSLSGGECNGMCGEIHVTR